jgi:hypothetical protein
MNKFSKLMLALSIIAAIFLCNKANAQNNDNKFRLGIGADGLVPVGSLTKTENFGLGITPRLQYSVNNKFDLVFTTGFYHFFSKNIPLTIPLGNGSTAIIANYHLDIIPVKAGLKYFVLHNLYLAGEAGAGFEVEDGGGPVDLILSPSVGYASKSWDVGLRYENFRGPNSAVGVFGVRIAYGFKL